MVGNYEISLFRYTRGLLSHTKRKDKLNQMHLMISPVDNFAITM